MDNKTCPVCSRSLDLHSDAEIVACSRALIFCAHAEKPRRTVQAPMHQSAQ